MSEYVWDPDDFAALWTSDGRDTFPAPLSYLSRFAYNDEVEMHRKQVRARYTDLELDDIEQAMRAVGDCLARIEILGGTTVHGVLREYRIVGGRTPTTAAVFIQTTTESGADGRIRVRPCRPADLGTQLATAVPRRDAGRLPQATFQPHDLAARPGNGLTRSPREQYQALVARPTDGGGVAAIFSGPLHARVDPADTVQWYDVVDDGRYLERRTRSQVLVRPGSGPELGAAFTKWLESAARRAAEQSWA